MIKVGIIGGASPVAGELLRLLVNHPDVKICQIYAPGLGDSNVICVHHGLIGEYPLKFTNEFNPTELDVVFVTQSAQSAGAVVPSVDEMPDLCVIDLTADFRQARESDTFVVYGVPEINRKALVRGARRAVIPAAQEVLAAVALQPLALRSMLPSSMTIQVSAGRELLDNDRVCIKNVGEVLALNTTALPVDLTLVPEDNASERVMRLSATFDLPLPIDNIVSMYEELYDDHNLTHIVGESVADKEVEGTDKCIITLNKGVDGMLNVQIAADARLRGGAGDAVHVMNLLMGLYEKTGLALRASRY